MDSKDLARTYIERVWNQGDAEAIDELVSEDFRSHDPVDREPVVGRDALKRLIRDYRGAFPDLVNTIHDMVAEDDKVAIRWSSTGTHQGPAFGLAATGRRRDVTGIEIVRIADGRIAEEWHSWDALGLLRQLGALPSSA